MTTSAGSTRGSTPSRWLGAIALRSAAALCALGALITLLVLLYEYVLREAGRFAALGALAGAFVILAGAAWIAARVLKAREERDRQLAEALQKLEEERQAQQEVQEAQEAEASDGDFGPWIRVASAASPALAAIIGALGPGRIVRWGLRAVAIWSAYRGMNKGNESDRDRSRRNGVHAGSSFNGH